MEDFELLTSEIGDKMSADVSEYYHIFQKKWDTLLGKLNLYSGFIILLIYLILIM